VGWFACNGVAVHAVSRAPLNKALGDMKAQRVIVAIGVAAILGLIIGNLRSLFSFAIPHIDSVIAPEYWIGFVFVLLLGYVFPQHAVVCAITFMWTPVAVRHGLYIAQRGAPNLWPLELAGIGALTLPYVGAAYAVAYLKLHTSENVT
jgi:hypothetical protein